jgi:tRNA threonylcarbamoyladenosine biosynthesis protein TsaB
MKFDKLTFIGVHSGPAPFTTLRVGIATANGLGFATGLPLVPVNGLQTLSMLYPEYTVLLNAFCDDVYVGKKGTVSCQNIDAFLREESKIAEQVTYIGNGAHLHEQKIKDILGDSAKILADYPYEAALNDIAHAAYAKWQNEQDIQKQVIPTYLKEYSAKVG